MAERSTAVQSAYAWLPTPTADARTCRSDIGTRAVFAPAQDTADEQLDAPRTMRLHASDNVVVAVDPIQPGISH
jgi:hypothetical protein